MNTKHKYKIIVIFMLANLPAFSFAKCNDDEAIKYALWRESRGQPEVVMRSVLDVINNRRLKYGKSACEVLQEKGQFPYFRHGIKPIRDKKFLTSFERVIIMEPVIKDKNVLYFNTTKHSFGRDCRKIGKLIFCK